VIEKKLMEPKKRLKKHNIIKPKRGIDLLMRMPVPYEPMTRNRYLMEVILDGRSYEFLVRCDFIYTVDEIPTNNSDRIYRLPIRRELSIDVRFIDFIDCTEEDLMRIIRTGSEGLRRRENFNVKIMKLDPTGITINEKRCYNCYFTSIVSNDQMDTPPHIDQIEATIKCDYFEETFS
jgi:hypothetical protein